ncbi:MAG: hypothetical protein IKM31_03510 [Oscillospiraceae bacterium]|nr:hypothetical protein [Oscillospiraceae bacterium]
MQNHRTKRFLHQKRFWIILFAVLTVLTAAIIPVVHHRWNAPIPLAADQKKIEQYYEDVYMETYEYRRMKSKSDNTFSVSKGYGYNFQGKRIGEYVFSCGNKTDGYWCRSVYFVLEKDGSVWTTTSCGIVDERYETPSRPSETDSSSSRYLWAVYTREGFEP